jgi:transposase-like protein
MTLNAIYKKFPTKESCVRFLEAIRWDKDQFCPYCSAPKYSELKGEYRYHCNICNTSYGVTVGTIFHRTRIDLQKWFFTILMITDMQNKGRWSNKSLTREISVNRNTVRFMIKRINRALIEQREIIYGILAIDDRMDE